MRPFGNTQRQEFQVCLPEVLRVEVAQYSPTLIDLICSSLREKATWIVLDRVFHVRPHGHSDIFCVFIDVLHGERQKIYPLNAPLRIGGRSASLLSKKQFTMRAKLAAGRSRPLVFIMKAIFSTVMSQPMSIISSVASALVATKRIRIQITRRDSNLHARAVELHADNVANEIALAATVEKCNLNARAKFGRRLRRPEVLDRQMALPNVDPQTVGSDEHAGYRLAELRIVLGEVSQFGPVMKVKMFHDRSTDREGGKIPQPSSYKMACRPRYACSLCSEKTPSNTGDYRKNMASVYYRPCGY